MELTILLTTLLNTFATTAPNLCDDVYRDPTGEPYPDWAGQTLSRYCEWTGPDAPVWDADVCCTIDEHGAACSTPDANDRCREGTRYSCEYGEATATGGVVCYQPLPDMCDQGLCLQAPEDQPPTAELLAGCCSPGGACQHVTAETLGDCEGYILVCKWGMVHVDGTLECFE